MDANQMNDLLIQLDIKGVKHYEVDKYIISAIYEKLFTGNKIPATINGQLNKAKLELTKDVISTLSYEDRQELVKHVLKGEFSALLHTDQNSTDSVGKLAISLMNIQPCNTILDFGCGEGAFLISAGDYIQKKGLGDVGFSGCDIDEVSCDLAKMVSEILGAGWHIELGDFLKRDTPLPDYDRAYVYPPFVLKRTKGSEYRSSFYDMGELPGKLSPEWYYVDKLAEQLGEGKRAVAVMPEKATYYGVDTPYRDFLLRKKLVEGVIELPKSVLASSPHKAILLVLSNNNERVRMVDATKMIAKRTGRFIEMSVQEIVDVYNSDADMENAKTVDYLTLMKNRDTVFTPSLLMAVDAAPKEGTQLLELADVKTGSQYTIAKFKQTERWVEDQHETNHRLLTSADIEESGALDVNGIKNYAVDNSLINEFEKHDVIKGDVIVTSKSTKVKVAVINEEPKGHLIVTGGMLRIRPKQGLLDPRFLKLYLDSKDGRAELTRIQKGSTILSINEEDLKRIVVPDLPIEEQRKLGDKADKITGEIKSLNKQLEEKREELKMLYE